MRPQELACAWCKGRLSRSPVFTFVAGQLMQAFCCGRCAESSVLHWRVAFSGSGRDLCSDTWVLDWPENRVAYT